MNYNHIPWRWNGAMTRFSDRVREEMQRRREGRVKKHVRAQPPYDHGDDDFAGGHEDDSNGAL